MMTRSSDEIEFAPSSWRDLTNGPAIALIRDSRAGGMAEDPPRVDQSWPSRAKACHVRLTWGAKFYVR